MKLDRLVSILMLLLEKDRVSAQTLAELFEVSPRTIYRDVETISMAGIPVRSTPGVGGGFEIMPAYKLDQKVFTADDLSTLLMGLSSLSGMLQSEALIHALTKVKSIIPADMAKEIEARAAQLGVDPHPWTGGETTRAYLATIQTALREHRLLSFAYIAHHGAQTTRLVEPYQLVCKGGQWYLYGYCRQREDFRLFKLSRITRLETKAEPFKPRAPQKPILHFSNMPEAAQTSVTLRIHRSIMDRVLDHCAYERFAPEDDEHYLVSFPFVESDYALDMLLGFGEKCECLAPPHVRAEMQRKARALAALYDA